MELKKRHFFISVLHHHLLVGFHFSLPRLVYIMEKYRETEWRKVIKQFWIYIYGTEILIENSIALQCVLHAQTIIVFSTYFRFSKLPVRSNSDPDLPLHHTITVQQSSKAILKSFTKPTWNFQWGVYYQCCLPLIRIHSVCGRSETPIQVWMVHHSCDYTQHTR